MKTLNVMNVKENDILNRNEMKGIIAGSGSDCTGNGCTNCVICYGSSHEPPEYFYHEYNGEDPSQVCRRSGPYPSGTWGQCY